MAQNATKIKIEGFSSATGKPSKAWYTGLMDVTKIIGYKKFVHPAGYTIGGHVKLVCRKPAYGGWVEISFNSRGKAFMQKTAKDGERGGLWVINGGQGTLPNGVTFREYGKSPYGPADRDNWLSDTVAELQSLFPRAEVNIRDWNS